MRSSVLLISLILLLGISSASLTHDDMGRVLLVDDNQCSNYTMNTVPNFMLCECATEYPNNSILFNYAEFYYCSASKAVVFIVILLWMLLLFYILAGTADEYLVPALTTLSELLELSPNVAGVTVLAFANGAPDVFTSLAAFSGGGSADLGVGSLLGAGMFVTSMVFGAVIFVNPFTSHRRPFLRDIIFYCIAIAMLYYAFITGKVYLWQSVLFVSVYIIYVLIVIIGRIVYQKYIKPYRHINSALLRDSKNDDDDDVTWTNMERSGHDGFSDKMFAQSHIPNSFARNILLHKSEQDTTTTQDDNDTPLPVRKEKEIQQTSTWFGSSSPKDNMHHDYFELSANEHKKLRQQDVIRRQSTQITLPSDQNVILETVHYVLTWEERTTIGKILGIIEGPFTLLRMLTIPIVEVSRYNKLQTSGVFLCMPVFIVAVLGVSLSVGMLIFIIICSVLSSILYYISTSNRIPTIFSVQLLLSFISFIMSGVWTYIIANELVCLMMLFGQILGISDAIIGVTVAAWGNSLGDFVGNVALSKEGYPRMAAAGCFGGPMFNLLMGAGLSFLLVTISSYPEPYVLASDPLSSISFVFVGISCLFTTIVAIMNRFSFTKMYGGFLAGLYILFVICLILGITTNAMDFLM